MKISKIILIIVFFFLAVCLGIAGISYRLYQHEFKKEIDGIQLSETAYLDLFLEDVSSEFATIRADLVIISKNKTLRHFIESPSKTTLQQLNEEFLTVSQNKPDYDKIRYIDLSGTEIARVNFNGRHSQIVPENELQDKSDRYYIFEALKMNQDDVFVSQPDLNIEHGVIAQPVKPMIRFATPIYDDNGAKHGILILNYSFNSLLKKADRHPLQHTGQTTIVNTDGYWLRGEKESDEWGFMYPDKKDLTLAVKNPDIWRRINSSESGYFFNAAGLLVFSTLHPIREPDSDSSISNFNNKTDQQYWKVITQTPRIVIVQRLSGFRKKLIVFNLVTVFLVAWLIVIISFYLTSRAKHVRTLQENEEKYRLLVESSNDAIVIRQENRFIFVNEGFVRMLGYTRDELLLMDYLAIFTPEAARNLLERQAQRELGEKVSDRYETQFLKKDGSEMPVEVNVDIIDYRGQKAAFAVIRDLTKQKEIMRELEKSARLTRNLEGFVPICAGCNKIRDDEVGGHPWVSPAEYAAKRLPKVQFSHGMCPDCMKKWYPDYVGKPEYSDKSNNNK